MANPSDRLYTTDHEWILIDDTTGTVGISDFAQNQLGEIVYVDLPEVGDEFKAGEPFGEVESVKSVSELLMPIAATITEVNEELVDAPDLVNSDCYIAGWLVRVKHGEADCSELMDSGAYDEFCSGL